MRKILEVTYVKNLCHSYVGYATELQPASPLNMTIFRSWDHGLQCSHGAMTED